MAVHYAPTARKHMGVTANRRWDRELERYASARAEGIQPATTHNPDIDRALAASDVLQEPFRADAAALAWDAA